MLLDSVTPRLQAGAGLPIALFIITVLALIVAGVSQLQLASGDSVSLQIQSQRAFFAAESGAQVAVRDVLEGDSCSNLPGTLSFSGAGLRNCSASFACEAVTADISGPGSDTVYTIISTGQCGMGPGKATRIIEVRAR